MEALRAGLTTTPSPSSSVSEGLDMFPESPQLHPHNFQLSPSDFRPRASSNASSIGRLSPIPAVESELQDSPWSPDYPSGLYLSGLSAQATHLDRFNPDQLVDNIAESMKIRENGFLTSSGSAELQHLTTLPPTNGYGMCHTAMQSNPHAYAPGYAANPQDYRPLPPSAGPTGPHSGLQRSGLPRSPQRLLNGPGDLVSAPPPPYSMANLQVRAKSTYGRMLIKFRRNLPTGARADYILLIGSLTDFLVLPAFRRVYLHRRACTRCRRRKRPD